MESTITFVLKLPRFFLAYRIFSKISRASFKLKRFLDTLIFESCLFKKSENDMKEIISSLCFKNVLIEWIDGAKVEFDGKPLKALVQEENN